MKVVLMLAFLTSPLLVFNAYRLKNQWARVAMVFGGMICFTLAIARWDEAAYGPLSRVLRVGAVLVGISIGIDLVKLVKVRRANR